MTSKNSLAAAMLVAALPAVVLAIFLVSSFLTGLGQLTSTFMALYAVTLLCCAGVVFLPVAVLIFSPKGPAARAKGEGSQDAAESAEKQGSQTDEPFDDAEAHADEEDAARPTSTGELEVVEAEPASTGDLDAVEGEFMSDEFGAVKAPMSDDELAATSDEVEGFGDDDFAFDDEVEEEKPKSKKKKGK